MLLIQKLRVCQSGHLEIAVEQSFSSQKPYRIELIILQQLGQPGCYKRAINLSSSHITHRSYRYGEYIRIRQLKQTEIDL